mgnify:CR=1 FL=1
MIGGELSLSNHYCWENKPHRSAIRYIPGALCRWESLPFLSSKIIYASHSMLVLIYWPWKDVPSWISLGRKEGHTKTQRWESNPRAFGKKTEILLTMPTTLLYFLKSSPQSQKTNLWIKLFSFFFLVFLSVCNVTSFKSRLNILFTCRIPIKWYFDLVSSLVLKQFFRMCSPSVQS